MNQNTRKIKLIIILAVATILLLLVCTIGQIISINQKQNRIEVQQEEISRLQNELNYYQNQDSTNEDDKNSDYDIVVGA